MIQKASWSGRGAGVEVIDLATRWPMYLMSGSEPFVVLLLVFGQPQVRTGPAVALLVLAVAHTASCILLLRAGLAQYLGGGRPATSLIVLPIALAVAGVALAGFLDGRGGAGGLGDVTGAVGLVFCGALTGALIPLLAAGRLFVVVALPAVGVALLDRVAGGPGRLVWAANYFLVVGTLAISYRFSVWFLGLAWEMNRSRQVQSQLAVAEERLRFARDLHDVLGRNLALIAVNSQLAAELVRRGQDGAIERMLDVHRTAQDSMREVREVVAGSRTSDLESELAGARSVLRSAGIKARVIGDGAVLPPVAQAALGWVVREATTNIIRHSDPTAVRIDLEIDPGAEPDARPVAVLRIENDGAPDPDDEPCPGTGLAGLRERLVTLGGDLAAGSEPDGRFVVQARLPLEMEP